MGIGLGLSSRASWLAIGLGIVLAKIKVKAEVIPRAAWMETSAPMVTARRTETRRAM